MVLWISNRPQSLLFAQRTWVRVCPAWGSLPGRSQICPCFWIWCGWRGQAWRQSFPTFPTFSSFLTLPTFPTFPTFPTYPVWSNQGLSTYHTQGSDTIYHPSHSCPPQGPPYLGLGGSGVWRLRDSQRKTQVIFEGKSFPKMFDSLLVRMFHQ